MRVIALSGWAGSGKDTVGQWLVDNRGFVRLSFADELKRMVSSQYNIPLEFFHDRELKDQPMMHVVRTDSSSAAIQDMFKGVLSNLHGIEAWTPRSLLILEASVKRAVDTNFWAKRVSSVIKNSNLKNVVITDLRYLSEIECLKEEGIGAVSVRVNRLESPASDDASENDLNDYDFDMVIDNTGTLTDLEEKLNSTFSG